MLESLAERGFQIEFHSHATAILAADFPEAVDELEAALRQPCRDGRLDVVADPRRLDLVAIGAKRDIESIVELGRPVIRPRVVVVAVPRQLRRVLSRER